MARAHPPSRLRTLAHDLPVAVPQKKTVTTRAVLLPKVVEPVRLKVVLRGLMILADLVGHALGRCRHRRHGLRRAVGRGAARYRDDGTGGYDAGDQGDRPAHQLLRSWRAASISRC